MHPRNWRLAHMFAFCTLVVLLSALSLLISLRVSAQAQTQRPAQHPDKRPAGLAHHATGAVAAPLAAAPFRPIIVDLGAGCGEHSSALAVNAAGVVAGECNYRAGLWQNNAWTELGALSGGNGTATAINDAGLVGGNSRIVNSEWPGGFYHAVLWNNGVISDLGTLGGRESSAYGINNSGAIAGGSMLSDNEYFAAFLWENGVMTPVAAAGTIARAVNDLGQVAGNFTISNHAAIWYTGVVTDLGSLGGGNTYAYAINNRGEVVGSSTDADQKTRAYLWANGVMTDLGHLGGGLSEAWGINDLGQVVGSSYLSAGPQRAFYWENGVMRELPALGASPGEDNCRATAINAGGLVVGECSTPSGLHAVMWDLWDNTSVYLPEIRLKAQ